MVQVGGPMLPGGCPVARLPAGGWGVAFEATLTSHTKLFLDFGALEKAPSRWLGVAQRRRGLAVARLSGCPVARAVARLPGCPVGLGGCPGLRRWLGL